MTHSSRIHWTKHFTSVAATMSLVEARALIRRQARTWTIVEYRGGFHACTTAELLIFLARAGIGQTVADALQSARQLPLSPTCRLQDMPLTAWVPDHSPTSADRYVLIDDKGRPIAVGGLDVDALAGDRGRLIGAMKGARPDPSDPVIEAADIGCGMVTAPAGGGVMQGDVAAHDDEARTPQRFPSIEAETPLTAGKPVTLLIDLLRSPARSTVGVKLALETSADWTSLDLDVIVTSPHIRFDGEGRATITIRRAAGSIPARITGYLTADPGWQGSIAVSAQFMHGTRLAGVAMRIFNVPDPASAPESAPESTPDCAGMEPAATLGIVHFEMDAEKPDVTIYIAAPDPDRPFEQHWQISTQRFEGLPPSLAGTTRLGSTALEELVALLNDLAALEPGCHEATIEGFADQLWERAPMQWKEAYWALWDHYQRPFSIQFISDDPYLPWELMRPARPGGREHHPPMALMHPVARWIRCWDGYMRSRLPAGEIFAIAPKYQSANAALRHAEKGTEALRREYGAVRIDGTYHAVKALFESAPSTPVAIVHFAGHGKFVPDVAKSSYLVLEDGNFSAREASRREIKLGVACRTLVIFNACEVGAAGKSMGAVGGWAEALLGREFGGFIAPLWSVADEDAAAVTDELLHGILKCGKPIAVVLRDIRKQHGRRAPTFYSYLYYGDVTARLGTR